MFSIHIDGLDGSLEWGKPTLAEAIAVASDELEERRFPVHATIIDSAGHQMVWEGTKSASGIITSTNAK